jgi:hypothetical protein
MNHLPKTNKKTPKSRKTKKEHTQISSYYIRYIVIPSIILLTVLTAKMIIKTYEHPLVLGTSTYALADNEAKQGGEFNSNGLPQKNSGNDDNQKDAIKKENGLNTSMRDSSQVDCIGPDDKHFQTSYQDCQNLNESWHHTNFSFTPLSKQQTQYLETPDLSEKMNISTSSADRFTIKKADTETHTGLPIKISSQSGKLTIATPAGVKEIQIEPDEAVKSLLKDKIFTTIQTNSSETKESSSSALINTDISKTVTLTSLNNQPVFVINGLSDKKVLGIIPMKFAKTVYLSTETGKIIKTNETPLTKFLETVSF